MDRGWCIRPYWVVGYFDLRPLASAHLPTLVWPLALACAFSQFQPSSVQRMPLTPAGASSLGRPAPSRLPPRGMALAGLGDGCRVVAGELDHGAGKRGSSRDHHRTGVVAAKYLLKHQIPAGESRAASAAGGLHVEAHSFGLKPEGCRHRAIVSQSKGFVSSPERLEAGRVPLGFGESFGGYFQRFRGSLTAEGIPIGGDDRQGMFADFDASTNRQDRGIAFLPRFMSRLYVDDHFPRGLWDDHTITQVHRAATFRAVFTGGFCLGFACDFAAFAAQLLCCFVFHTRQIIPKRFGYSTTNLIYF